MEFLEKNKVYKRYCRRCKEYVDVICFYPTSNKYYPFLLCMKCGATIGIAYK